MNKRDARRVAEYHSTNPGCTAFTEHTLGKYRVSGWTQHFEYDLKCLNSGETGRQPVAGEGELILRFLTTGIKAAA